MHKLVYISTATEDFSADDLARLLEVAREKNRQAGITGLLLMYEMQFFQILEGEKEALDACYAHIEKDPRHKGLITLMNEETDSRQFPNWDMGAVHMDDFSGDLRSSIVDLLKIKSHPSYDALRRDEIVGIFADTYLADLSKFSRELAGA